jgi:molecular chaperone DnaJ
MGTVSADDAYALLGVGAQAGTAEVRRAWRKLALRWHPDRAGPGGKAVFQMLSAAYTLLADPVTRAAYDERRSPGAPGASRSYVDAGSADARRPQAPGVLLRRLSGPLNALLMTGVARRANDEVIDLHLDAQEISDGGMVSISMHVAVRCAACVATAPAPCERCGTRRTIDELFTAWLAVPPGVAEGTHLIPSAMLPGMVGSLSFRVRRT